MVDIEELFEKTTDIQEDITSFVNEICPSRVGSNKNHGEKAIAKAVIFAKILELKYTEEVRQNESKELEY